MKHRLEAHPQARRSFLKSVMAIAGGVAVSSAQGASPQNDIVPTIADKAEPEPGYHESEHIKRYYQTARL